MSSAVITVEDGIVTIVTEEVTMTVQAHCPSPEPTEFVPNPVWPDHAGDEPVRFSFVAGTCGNNPIGFGYDSCGYFGTVNEFPNGVTEASNIFTINYRPDTEMMYVSMMMDHAIGNNRPARATITNALTGKTQTLVGGMYSNQFQVQDPARMELVEDELYYVEFAVASGGE